MTGSIASVSDRRAAEAVRWAMIGVNWIGDAVMSMPALYTWRQAHPGARLRMLARPPLDELWERCPPVDEVQPWHPTLPGMLRAARQLREWRPDVVVVLPHSIRSTLLARLSGARQCVATHGTGRRWLGFEIRSPPRECFHQRYDFAAALGVVEHLELPRPPWIRLTPEDLAAAAWVGNLPDGPRLALMPGAARGPSKRWRAERFAAVAAELSRAGWYILVLGSAVDRDIGHDIAAAAGARGRNCAGETTLGQWAAVLAACDLALCNDSGGMHLAAAMGLPGVAIFGATDPHRTGPIGEGWTILQKAPVRSARIRRNDSRAEQWLDAIQVSEVVAACQATWNRWGAHRINE